MRTGIFLNSLLRLFNQSLLKALHFAEKVEHVRVSAFQLVPSMVVHWVLKLLRQCLYLQTFLLQGVAELDYFLLIALDLASPVLLQLKFAFQLADLVLEKLEIG